MTETQEIPAEIMAEAFAISDKFYASDSGHKRNLTLHIARALLARDTAARKECAEIARADGQERIGSLQADAAFRIATAIEATITGGRND
jgi:hypothetical protein